MRGGGGRGTEREGMRGGGGHERERMGGGEEERVGRGRTLASARVVVGLGECCLDGVLSTTNTGVDSLSADPLWGEVGA